MANGNLGLLYAKKGMNDEAPIELARGLAFVPDPNYHLAMARILAEHKEYPLAIYHYNEAARSLNSDAGVFTGLAEIYAAAGQQNKALDEYRQALTVDPGSEKAYIGIATIYLSRNEQDKALEELKKAETASPQNREIHLMMADIHEKTGDYKQADYHYLLGGKSKPSRMAVNKQEDDDNSIEGLKALLKRRPDSVKSYEKLGRLYQEDGKETKQLPPTGKQPISTVPTVMFT